ncbi:MAG: SusC/RagA family TonB-linked outer membrane protein [Balneola sp.]|nr:SusC/RagA family TonB-linked outer membrane protein [Balneola sp.]MBO6649487.1 SusC/RagA family TonB-linked outer membrane protein [Balneola sp.]MBO6711303.1 SusC/RagA family TonB-linked outer membrane protein [Balneola sp.]MBO6800582.1 SusC/RagA family TonB-linked outer membrane protein [Balneola sp.]MBO6869239.1 SusC/RagA family TonB-linked outer membrane protein [Balneola sp.]
MKNNKLLTLLLHTCVVLILLMPNVHAQNESNQFVLLEWYDQDYQAKSLYEKIVSLTLDDISLEEALKEIAEQGKLQLSYNKQLIPDQKITLKLEKIKVKEALEKVLENTNLELLASPRGQVVIKRKISTTVIDGTLTGTVIDGKTGEPMVGVTIIVKGTTKGASTDLKGNYTINNVPLGSQIITAAFISFNPVSKPIEVSDGINTLNFELMPDILSMNELVVTATGVRRKVEIGNSIARIDAIKDVKTRPISDVSGLLQGQAAGVQIVNSGGATGMGTRIRIRGSNSASLSNEPVIYVDGVRINNDPNSISFETGGQAPSRLGDLNPENIESIEVIKGPSAATLYGSVAANGVIRITTKKGKSGEPRWVAFTETGIVNNVTTYPDNFRAVDASGNPCFTFEAAEGTCTQSSISSYQPLNESVSSPYRTGNTYGLGLSVSGGSETSTYFISGNYADNQGTLPVNNLKKASLRGNFQSYINEDLKVTLNTGYTNSNLELPMNGTFSIGLLGQGLNGQATPDVNNGWGEFTPAELFTVDSRQQINRFTTGLETEWIPSQNLNFRLSGGLDYTSRWDNQFFPTGTAPDFLDFKDGVRISNRFDVFNYTLDANGTYSKAVSENLSSRTSVGFQYLRDLTLGTLATGRQLVAGTGSIAGAANTTSTEQTTEQRTVGMFLEERLNFQDKLFVTGAVRADRGSAFGAQFNAVVYPKVSASWLISEESFFSTSRWLSSLRLRSAWGDSGVQPGTNDALRFFIPIASTVNGESVTGVTFGGVGNSDLKPERSREFEIGMDATMLSDRVALEVTYFNKQTQDALIFRQLPPSLGAGGGRFENLGSVANTGFELSLSSTVFQNETAYFDFNIVGSLINNELKELGNGIEPILISSVQRHVEGYPLGGYWDEKYTFSDANGDGLIGRNEVTVGDEAVYLGSPFGETDVTFTGTTGLLGDRIVVSALLNYRGGRKLYNNTNAWRNGNNNTEALNDPNTSLENQARAVASKFFGTEAGYIEDASFWRLREVSLTYNAPLSWLDALGVSDLSLTLSGANLGLWTNYTGLDPEISSRGQGNFIIDDFMTQPPVRTWKARLNISF